MSRKDELKNLSLGEKTTSYPTTYSPKALETFSNHAPQSDAWTTFLCPEFTVLCPKTNQPDFGYVTINYVAHHLMVESKSLKLYLFSFRNHGHFHEDSIQTICQDLGKLLAPKLIEVIGEFRPRGGISIYPYVSQDNGEEKYKRLREHRMTAYAPGKYSTRITTCLA